MQESKSVVVALLVTVWCCWLSRCWVSHLSTSVAATWGGTWARVLCEGPGLARDIDGPGFVVGLGWLASVAGFSCAIPAQRAVIAAMRPPIANKTLVAESKNASTRATGPGCSLSLRLPASFPPDRASRWASAFPPGPVWSEVTSTPTTAFSSARLCLQLTATSHSPPAAQPAGNRAMLTVQRPPTHP